MALDSFLTERIQMLAVAVRKVSWPGLVLAVASLFLGLALVSYSPLDPPAAQVYPRPEQVANWLGPAGAYLAWGLYQLLGWGAWFLWASLAVLAWVLLSGRRVDDPLLRWHGWLLALVGWCTLWQLALPDWSPGPVLGAGGYLGAVVQQALSLWMAQLGSWLVALSLFAAGMLLCADQWVLRAMGLALRGTLRTTAWLLRVVLRRRLARAEAEHEPHSPTRARTKRKAATLIDPEDEEEQDEQEPLSAPGQPTLRIRQRKRPSTSGSKLDLVDTAADEEQEPYEFPPLDLLLPADPVPEELQEQEIIRKARKLEKTFADFGYNVQVVEVETGPVISQYEVELEAGLRLSKIMGLADDLAVALRVPSVRIVAPIPGKNTVGIEVPNSHRQLVRLREVIEEASDTVSQMALPLFLGKDVAGNPLAVDLAKMPHLLIAGRTGTGKSVCLNSLIMSILMTRSPRDVKLLLVDPKMVELSLYGRVPHLMHPVVTDMKKAEAILGWAVEKMEDRYRLLMRARVRHIAAYNRLGREELLRRIEPESEEEAARVPTHLPYIVIVADEMADLMMTAPKEVESYIIRLAQKSRAVGIHLILATQKPTVDVITGLIKSNLPARISFQVASRTDSRVVLDEMGAERLLGNGDMLFLWPGTSTLLRGQGCFVSDDEIHQVVQFVGRREPEFAEELVQLEAAPQSDAASGAGKPRDELYEAAVEVVVQQGRGSVSLLQRALGIGYGRAARLIDFMAEDGIVGPYNGSQAREVLITPEQWAKRRQEAAAPPVTSSPTARRRVVLRPSGQEEAEDQQLPWPSGVSDSAGRGGSKGPHLARRQGPAPREPLAAEEDEEEE